MSVLVIQVLRRKVSDLRLGTGGSYKHFDKSYDNIFGIGIPYMLMNFLPCHGFLKNKYSVVILKFPNRMFEYYFSKEFIIFGCYIFLENFHLRSNTELVQK